MSFLRDQYVEMKRRLRLLLDKQEYIYITTDVWSSRAQSYLGMTVHYINERFQRESYVLSFKQLKHRQTYEELTTEIVAVLEEYGIVVDKITHMVTDGGSSFCKAFKVFGKGRDHLINNTYDVTEENEEEEVVEGNLFMQNNDGEPFYSNILILDNDEELEWLFNEDENDDNFDVGFNDSNEQNEAENITEDDFLENPIKLREKNVKLPPRRCLLHICNLLAGDFEKELSGRAKSAFVAVLSKLQTIWVFPRRSSQAKKIAKDILGCTLKLPCETRWNSKYDAIKHIFELRAKINTYVEELKLNIKKSSHLSKITNDDWAVIAAYLKIMKPIADSLDRLQSEKNGGQGLIMPTFLSMRHHIATADGGNCTRSSQETMLKIIDRRFFKHVKFNEANKELILASVSTPKFKANFIRDEQHFDIARQMLVSECVELSPQTNDRTDNEATSSNNSNDDDFFLTFSLRRNIRRNSFEQSVEAEVERYLNDEREENIILNEYPYIREVYFRHNTTLSSSAPIERVFSQSALIFTPRQNRIHSTNFESALLLKLNKRLFL